MARIKDLQKIDLPREKLLKYGPKRLSDFELLATLLGSGIKGKNVLQLSKRVLKIVADTGVSNVSKEDLLLEKGLGVAKVAQILAIIELGQRISSRQNTEILSDRDIWLQCSDIRASRKEHFLAFYLDTQSRLIERQIVSVGTLSISLVHPREVYEPAIRLNAASLIVAHNHPSGNLVPSGADIQITSNLMEAGRIMGIPLEKHVIVTSSGFVNIVKHV